MDQSAERFFGVIPNCRYKQGLGYKMAVYDLFVTNQRLILVKAWAPLLGVVAAATPPPAFQTRIQRYSGKTVEQLLSLDKRNLFLPFDHIARAILMEGNPRLLEQPNLTIWIGGDRTVFQFEKGEFAKARELLAAALGAKLELGSR